MDCEKLYNEALSWMRKIYPTLTGANKEDAEHYFPELKESKDERIRTRLIALVEAFGQGEYKDELLDYLEKQKEKKSAEWSEEDERITAKLLSYFNEFDESTSFGSREVIEIRHWLKSLRPQPHWKPSEEQMKAILDAMIPATGNTLVYLNSLYEQLKAL